MLLLNQLVLIILNHFFILFLSEGSIPEEFFALFTNQTRLLTSIYNYTSKIPDLELLVREIAPSSPLNQSQNEQSANVTQNCTNVQNVSAEPVVPACPVGAQAPGKRFTFNKICMGRVDCKMVCLSPVIIEGSLLVPGPFWATALPHRTDDKIGTAA